MAKARHHQRRSADPKVREAGYDVGVAGGTWESVPYKMGHPDWYTWLSGFRMGRADYGGRGSSKGRSSDGTKTDEGV